MTPQDQNDPTLKQALKPATPPENSDPGYFQRVMQGGVLGMPVSEALLRFGSGLLSGDDWNSGLARAGGSLVQGSQQARAQQMQQAAAERRFQEARMLQNDRIAAQERITRLRTTQDADRTLAGERLIDPQSQTLYFTDRNRVFPLGSETPLDPRNPEHSQVLGRLQRAPQMVTTGDQQLQRTNIDRYNALLQQGQQAESSIRDIDTVVALAQPGTNPDGTPRQVDTGAAIPRRLLRWIADTTGIQVGENSPETLDVMRQMLGRLNADQRGRLLAGLAPVSNAEYQSANEALSTINTDPNALIRFLQIQRQSLDRAYRIGKDLAEVTPAAIARDGLTVDAWVQRRHYGTLDSSQPAPRTVSNPEPRGQPRTVDPPAQGAPGAPVGTYRPGQGVVRPQTAPPAASGPAPGTPPAADPPRPSTPTQGARENALIRQRQLEQSPEYQRASQEERLAMRRALARELAAQQGR